MHGQSISDRNEEQTRQSIHFLYHEIRSCPSKYSYVLQEKMFERHVDLFAQIGKRETSSLHLEMTFDDGHISNSELALPILTSRGLRARFFITAGWTEQKPGYMGWRELRMLHESGHHIGAHGWSHALLTHCIRKELETELSRARMVLEDKLGTAITTMSLPGGRYNRRVLAACREAGYTQVYTSVPRAEPEPPGFMVGRINIRGNMTIDWITNLIESRGRGLAGLDRQYRMKAAMRRLLGDRLYAQLWAVLNKKELDSEFRGAHENPSDDQ